MNWRGGIRIARIIARLNVGGPAIQAILMTEALRARGYNTVLITGQVGRGEANMHYLAQAHEVEALTIPALSRSICYKDIASLLQLVRMLRRHRPAIVHTHTAKAGTLGRLAAMIVRAPIRVHTFHGHVFNGYFSPFVSGIFLRIERFLARRTDCIIAISESQKRDLTETYRIAPAHKVTIIPLGLDLDAFLKANASDDTVHNAIRRDPSVPLVGWVGRLTAIKAPGLFLDCVPLVKDSFPATHFVVVGGGELHSECEQRVEQERLQDSVALLGWQRDLPRIYAGLEMVVCTSINEGTPVALLEAMASGKAIVSTDVGGVRDLMAGRPNPIEGMELFENGILVPRDPQLLARAILYLLGNRDQCRSMGQVGRQFVRNRYSQIRLADDLERLYLSLARAKGLLPKDTVFPACPPSTSVFSAPHTPSL